MRAVRKDRGRTPRACGGGPTPPVPPPQSESKGKTMADEKKIDELVRRAVEAGLEGVDFIQRFDYADLCREYNGIGPEWAGECIRAWATGKLALFEPAALIHDMRNAESDGTREGFERANDEFFRNCRRLADRAYPWWRPRRYIMRYLSVVLYDFVAGPGGWVAWRECALARREKLERERDAGKQ